MPIRKAPPARTAPIIPVRDDPDSDVRNKLLDDVEVKSLALDDSFDPGGDPYNRTGQFATLKEKNKKR